MSDLMREEFEVEAAKVFEVDLEVLRRARTNEGFDGFPYRVVNDHGEQSTEVNSLLGFALLFWQASREALVIELPDVSEMAGRAANGNCYSAARLDQHALVIKCIHAAGVKTK